MSESWKTTERSRLSVVSEHRRPGRFGFGQSRITGGGFRPRRQAPEKAVTLVADLRGPKSAPLLPAGRYPMFKPLLGRRVIDVTLGFSRLYRTYQLALLGAEVIKIEFPDGGDWTRGGGKDAELSAAGLALLFVTQNSAKKSVAIDGAGPAVWRPSSLDRQRRCTGRKPQTRHRRQAGHRL